jgi:hypothetical protein
MPHNFPPEEDDLHIDRRKSDVFGEVRLYAPSGDPSTWGEDGWLLLTEHGDFKNGQTVEERWGPGIKVLVRQDRAMHLLHNTTHLSVEDLWVDETAEVERAL